MLFCTFEYLVFFLVVFAVYWSLPWARARVWLLLCASFFFYACFNKWLALLIGVSTVVDYYVALGIDAPAASQRRRKGLLCFSLISNLGLLCYFKYANFFLGSFFEALRAAGLREQAWEPLKIILPVGVSFYTFEAINYVVDVYLRKAPAEKDLSHFMLFITFFPHLVAGPIVRARDFLPQIRRHKHFSWLRMHVGLQYVLMGMFKKTIADRMSEFADPVFADAMSFQSGAAWMAIIAYTIQVFCDFSGYTDIAIGCAHMLGYRLAENFNMPYLATSIPEYWRRWHMSLSGWLRDYLFIPLGGSRGTFWFACRNMIITFVLCGLWHGAAWHYVGFGLLQGVYMSVHRAFREWCKVRPIVDGFLQRPLGTALRWAVTMVCTCAGYVVFRSETFEHAGKFFTRLFAASAPGAYDAPMPAAGLWMFVGIVLVAHLAGARRWWERCHLRLPAPVLGTSYAAVLTVALMLATAGKPFIYFAF